MNRSSITLRQLESFVTLSETRHFRQAASRLGISQPTLTSQIAKLERGLGTSLFERSHSQTTLTAAGRELIGQARRVVHEFETLREQASSTGEGLSATYRLGITPTLGPYLLPHILPDLHEQHARLKLFVREDAPRDNEVGLLTNEHDLIITPLPLDAPEHLTVMPLFLEPLKLVLSSDHRLAGRKLVRAEELSGESVLTLQEHHLFYRQVEELCRSLGARVLRDFEGTSLDTLRQMVVMGMGVSFLPALYVHSEIREPSTLHVTSVQGQGIERTHALVWRATSPDGEIFEQLARDIQRSVTTRLSAVVRPLE